MEKTLNAHEPCSSVETVYSKPSRRPRSTDIFRNRGTTVSSPS